MHTTEEQPTLIGADCVVGHRAHLEGCVVEDGCLIGSGALVLNRARVAAGAVVAAAALVLEDMTVPAGALAIGVPASIRPDAGLRQQAWIKHAVQAYLDLAERHRTGLRRLDRPAVPAPGPGTPDGHGRSRPAGVILRSRPAAVVRRAQPPVPARRSAGQHLRAGPGTASPARPGNCALLAGSCG